MTSPRVIAWLALRSGSASLARKADRLARDRGLAPRDRRLAVQLVAVEARRRGTLRAIVRHFKPHKPSPELAAHFHIGLVQALFLDRVPEHAAIAETTGAARKTLGPGAARATIAFMREVVSRRRAGASGDPRCDLVLRPWHFEKPVFHDPAEHPLLWAEDALSMPALLQKRFVQRFGDETARKLALWALAEPPLSLRPVGVDRELLAAELARCGVDALRAEHPRTLLVAREQAERALRCPALAEGRATVQGATALAAAEAVRVFPGDRVLDLCAAPGGKTAALAEAGARVVACDVSARKLERLSSTLARLQLAERVELVLARDGLGLRAGAFDAVLVDAPCTNTGVLAQRPEARWRFGPKAKADLAVIQRRLFEAAGAAVRPGGRLVFSTCSLESDENGRAVRAFLAAHAEFTLDEEREALPDLEAGIGPIDGGYFARLVRAR